MFNSIYFMLLGWENLNFDVLKVFERWKLFLDVLNDYGLELYGRIMDSRSITQIQRNYLGKYFNSSNLLKFKVGEEYMLKNIFEYEDYKVDSSR